MEDYRQRKQNPIEYRYLLIEDIILGLHHSPKLKLQ